MSLEESRDRCCSFLLFVSSVHRERESRTSAGKPSQRLALAGPAWLREEVHATPPHVACLCSYSLCAGVWDNAWRRGFVALLRACSNRGSSFLTSVYFSLFYFICLLVYLFSYLAIYLFICLFFIRCTWLSISF